MHACAVTVQVLDDALAHRPDVRALWDAAINFEEQVGGPEATSRALDLYDRWVFAAWR
jgi:pre-mRNA-processing factor 39